MRPTAGSSRTSGRTPPDAWKSRVWILCIAAVCSLVACRQQTAGRGEPAADQTPERPLERIDPADAVFGYTDDTGSRLLMLSDDNIVLEAGKAKAMQAAVCSEGREITIRYLQFQKRTPASNGRQSAGNLKNDEGHLFEIAGAQAEPGDTCLLVPPDYLRRFPVTRNEFPEAERQTRQNNTTGRMMTPSRPSISLRFKRRETLPGQASSGSRTRKAGP